jgi:UDP-glucose 4-epimerase
MTTVLITGAHGQFAGLVARMLAEREDVRVIGVTTQESTPSTGFDVRVTNGRGTELLDVLQETGAQVVVHLDQVGEEQPAKGREAAVQSVLKTIELLGACATTSVRRIVLRSSTLVYGARYDQPLFLKESAALHSADRLGIIKDYVEIERFVADFARKHPHLSIVQLRLAWLTGAGVTSPLTRYLDQPTPRMLLGFNPLIQIIHPHDAAHACTLAALADDISGPFNIAADTPLTLEQAIRLAGRQPLPLPEPAFNIAGLLGGGAKSLIGALPFDPIFLRYSCIADTAHAHNALGFTPTSSTQDALRELAPATPQPADEPSLAA